jgi:hypothetical protein
MGIGGERITNFGGSPNEGDPFPSFCCCVFKFFVGGFLFKLKKKFLSSEWPDSLCPDKTNKQTFFPARPRSFDLAKSISLHKAFNGIGNEEQHPRDFPSPWNCPR